MQSSARAGDVLATPIPGGDEPRASRPSLDPLAYDYLLLSDVHLGSDIVTHLRPWARQSWLTHEAEVDDQLVSMLSYHRHLRRRGRPICLVLAGDFLDLVGVSLSPPKEISTRPNREERLYGLGSAPDHVVCKVRAIAERHPRVFRALMELVAEGNKLVIVRGNHDIELHWQAAQRALVDAIVTHAPEERSEALRARISIHPWFFAVDGLLYVEHGHHFDAMCSYGDPLLPTCPRDSRRIRAVPFSVMLRNVARPTRGLSTTQYEHVSFGEYLRLLVTLGVVGSARIAVRFARATSSLVSQWMQHVRGDRPLRRHAATARWQRFAAQSRRPLATLRALAALYVRPAAHSLPFVLRSLYLDRLLSVLSALALLVAGARLALAQELVASLVCALVGAACAAYALIGSERGILPIARMRLGAEAIAELFSARWVVMGHTHQPALHELARGAHYVNLGHWGHDDLPEERAQAAGAPCTYLQLRLEGHDYRAELLRWDAQRGPVRVTVHGNDPAPPAPEVRSFGISPLSTRSLPSVE